MTKFFAKTALAALLAGAGLCACNEDEKDYSIDGIDLSVNQNSNTAITEFNLKANRKVLVGLDSVFFSIDLENFSIYNADSLPKGTDVGKLLVSIGNSGSSKIVINYTDFDTKEKKEIEYSETSYRDSINFYEPVTITVTSLDERYSKTYDVKVNVHQVEADSLCWGSMQYSPLPADGAPVEQGTVLKNDMLYCFTARADGSVTLATTATPELPQSWSKQTLSLPFAPRLETVKADSRYIYMLDKDGVLYGSEDALTWMRLQDRWVSTLGVIDDTLYGIRLYNGQYQFVNQPTSHSEFDNTPVPDDFPVTGMSQMFLFVNQWSSTPQGIIIGGRCADGSLSDCAWGFDGKEWARFGTLPEKMALENMTMFPYYTFKTNQTNWTTTRYQTLFAFGGSNSDGVAQKKVYVSRDNGLNWLIADDLMQLPEAMPTLTGAQAFVIDQTLHADAKPKAAGVWNEIPVRGIPTWYQIETAQPASRAVAPITEWTCPYVYLFGGRQQDGQLSNSIWRGAINRLTFKPLQ